MSCNNSCNNCSCDNTENSVLGLYKLKEAMRFRVTNSSFELSEGSLVKVTQVDSNFHKILIEFEETITDWFSDKYLDFFIKVDENSYEDFNDTPEYQEFIYHEDYSVGEYFKIGKEIFKVTTDIGDSCKNCEFNSGILLEYCEKLLCSEYGRSDRNNVCVILYDTLED